MKSKLLISVIIPTRNSALFLIRNLESFKKQTNKNFEVIIADNDSSDDTKKITLSYNYSYISTSKVAPQVCLQRNLGAKIAKGEYLLFLDHDMELPPNFMALVVIEINKNPEIDAWYIPETILAYDSLLTNIRNFENKSSIDTVVAAARLIRRSKFFSTTDLYDLKLSGGPADWDMDIQLKEIGSKFKILNAHIFHHEKNLTLFQYITKKAQYVKGIQLYKEKWRIRDIKKYDSIVQKQFNPIYRAILLFFENGKWKRTLLNMHLYILVVVITFLKGMQYQLNKSK